MLPALVSIFFELDLPKGNDKGSTEDKPSKATFWIVLFTGGELLLLLWFGGWGHRYLDSERVLDGFLIRAVGSVGRFTDGHCEGS